MSAKLAVSVHYIYILYLYLLNFFLKNRNALISLTRVRVLRSCYQVTPTYYWEFSRSPPSVPPLFPPPSSDEYIYVKTWPELWSNLKMFLSGDWDWIIFTLSPPFTEGRNESDRSILNSWNVSRQSVSVSPSSNMASRQSCLTSNILLWNISILKYIILFHISWLNSFVRVPYRHSLEGDNYCKL